MADGPKQVTAFQGYGVYADYDAYAPDTEDLVLVANEDQAKQVCAHLNKNPRRWGCLAFVDGLEHRKVFKYREALRLNAAVFATPVEELLKGLEEDRDPPVDDEDPATGTPEARGHDEG